MSGDLKPHDHWPFPTSQESLQRDAQELVRRAEAAGFVITIEQQPLQPLAMGHYRTTVGVRPARGKA